MFFGYTGVGTGYRALRRSHLPATSSQIVTPQAIRESMEYYNKMFASSYIQTKHPEIANPYADTQPPIRDLNTTIKEHTVGSDSIWNSPFASTSLDYRQSKSWARRFEAPYANNAQHGILFKAQLPKEGTVLTFGQKFEGLTATGIAFENEALVAGGLQPASIAEIEVFDRNSPHNNPSLSAKRVESDGKAGLVVEDRRGKFVVQRTYGYMADTARFELAGEVATQIPSAIPVKEPTPFSAAIQNLLDFVDKNKNSYESPFKYEKIFTNLIKESNFNEYKMPKLEKIIENKSHIFKDKLFEKEKNIFIPKDYSGFIDEFLKKKPPKKY